TSSHPDLINVSAYCWISFTPKITPIIRSVGFIFLATPIASNVTFDNLLFFNSALTSGEDVISSPQFINPFLCFLIFVAKFQSVELESLLTIRYLIFSLEGCIQQF